MSIDRLLEILEYQKEQPDEILELLEEEYKNQWTILSSIERNHLLLNEYPIKKHEEMLENLGYDGKKIIERIKNIIHFKKDIDIHHELIREPIDIFLANNNIIIEALNRDLIVGKLIINPDKEKKLPITVFARTFFVHYKSNNLKIEDFCYSQQINDYATDIFLENVLGETPDILFMEAIKNDDFENILVDFFNKERDDYPEIISFTIVE